VVDHRGIDLGSLSPQDKRELLRRLLQERAKASTSFPLSYGQEGLWFLYRMSPQSPAYNFKLSARLRGPLDMQAMQRTCEALLDRHPSLRTTFATTDTGGVQRVHEHMPLEVQVIDSGHWSEADLKEQLGRAADRPFDLEHGPPVRVSLYRRSPDEHVLALMAHHIIVDYWSFRILFGDLFALYAAEVAGVNASLATHDHSYADFVNWQRDMLAGAEGERLRTYWHQKLPNDLPVLKLPTDRPRPAMQTFSGVTYSTTLPRSLADDLRSLSVSTGASLYTIFVAALQVLLHRYTGQDDILVGSPMLGRSRAEFQDTIGFFVNALVLRGDLSGNPSFRAFLSQSRSTVLEAMEHQDYPFSLLVQQLALQRDPSRSSVLQVMIGWEKMQQSDSLNIPLEGIASLAGIEVMSDSIDFEQRGAALDLVLSVFEGADESLRLTFQYNTELFDSSTIERMAEHLKLVLAAVAADPDQRIADLPLIGEAERERLLVEWNETEEAADEPPCVCDLFEGQVERIPDSPALIWTDGQLTYGELNAKANRLAHHLKALGVGPDSVVGICVAQCWQMVVGIMGVLKAGGAYLPLDHTHGRQRLALMFDDAQPARLLTDSSLVAELPDSPLPKVCLDEDWPKIAQRSVDNPPRETSSENLIYVMYKHPLTSFRIG